MLRSQKILLFIAFAFLLYSGLYAGWIDIYNNGGFTLAADPGFGKNTDWDAIFYNTFKHIVATPGGEIFVSDIRQSVIFKFDSQGNLTKRFGQPGNGPADLNGPSDLSVLDNKYLIVKENSESNRRISIFDLEGKFIDIIRFREFILNAVALRDGKIAYLSRDTKPDGFVHSNVKIVDFYSKNKSIIQVAHFKSPILKTNIHAAGFYGRVFIKQMKDGCLLVGNSDEPYVTVYSPEGKKLQSFKVNFSPLPVTTEMQDQFFELLLEEAGRKPVLKAFLKREGRLNRDKIFPRFLPYYRHILVDGDGRILIFKHNGLRHIKSYEFQVYSDSGGFLCQSVIQFGEFQAPDIRLMSFSNDKLYCILEKSVGEDSSVRLTRVKVK